mgnify:CR=1 FL=1
MQGELMAVDHQPILLTDGMVHLTVQSKMGQIDDRAAVFANKVAMGGDNGVKTLLSLNDSYAPNIASLLKEDEIAVHGAAADFLVLLAYVQIDIVRCRMIIVRANGVEHKRALARVASLHTHGDPFRCIYTAPVA